jgi:predicted transcriptional regulator
MFIKLEDGGAMEERTAEFEELLGFFKALGDEKRLKIVGLLAQKSLCVEELAAILGLSAATVSHHLRKLVEAGLVEASAEGYYNVYSLRAETLREMSKRFLSAETFQETARVLDLGSYDRKVLRDYLEDGRLKTIPAQRKKRDVILRYILQEFEPSRRYAESEVNEIISRFHEDYATIRREFIMRKMMDREGGGGDYWRIEAT